MNWIRKTAALLAAACLLTGCTKAPQEPPPDAAELIAETPAEPLSAKVRSEEIPLPDDYAWILSGECLQEPDALLFYGKGNAEMLEVRLDAQTYETSLVSYVMPAAYDHYYFRNLVYAAYSDPPRILAVMENHSDMDPITPGTPDDAYDWEQYNSAAEMDFLLCTYAEDGTLVDSVKVEGLDPYRQTMLDSIFSCAIGTEAGLYFFSPHGLILRMEPDGRFTETAPATAERRELSVIRDGLGRFVQVARNDTPSGSYYTAREFDPVTGTCGEPFYSSEGADVPLRKITAGAGDYRLLLYTQDLRLLGLREDGSTELLIDWDNRSLFDHQVFCLADGTFLAYDREKLRHLTRLPLSEVPEVTELTIGILGPLYDIPFVDSFNAAQEDCHLTAVPYEGTAEEGLERLRLEAVSGKAPDLVLIREHHSDLASLGERGVFCDLSSFIQTDDVYNPQNILPNYLEAMQSRDGALYSLTPGFGYETLCVKQKFWDKEGWRMEDMIGLYDAHASEASYGWMTRENMLLLLLDGLGFVEQESCHFDSPEFVQFLEFCGRFTPNTAVPEDDPMWYTRQYQRYQRDEDFVNVLNIGKMGYMTASAWAYMRNEMGEDSLMAGFPGTDGANGRLGLPAEIAVTTACPDKESAWAAVKAYLDTGTTKDSAAGISILESHFERQLDDQMYIWDFVDGIFTRTEQTDLDSKVGSLIPMSQAERDHLEERIRSCRTVKLMDEHVRSIVLEEAGMYFSGDRSAQDSAKMIQDRVSLFLSERN